MPEIPNYGLYEDPRHCVEGRSNECHSVQESHSWLDRSYLQEIALCQDERPFAEWDKSWMWHFAAMSYGCCPYGCSKVHLNRLRVPEALRPYHPGRRYEAKFEKS
ncbi:hypothetical protein EV356DRAFT_511052 [Viridothelium virens]|uniref:Uncharacterized protein n=1 Tax=Viridothelium virens TaxID=1048519 RepID=A0A6A6GU79_VIRVR|nr:hypothetical protein EV356DRAFT_511052 [Viridothelium virens]